MKEEVAQHINESVPVRDSVAKSAQQIITLERAHEATMADIRVIKDDISAIKTDIKDLTASVKIWVLSGICGTIMAFAVPTMMLFYNAGRMQMQVDINTDKWRAFDTNKDIILKHTLDVRDAMKKAHE
jgi:hypothetical protein